MKAVLPDLKTVVQKAYELRTLVPHFNIPYLPMVKPVIETLTATRTFGLVAVSRIEVEKFGSKSYKALAEEYFKYADNKYTRLHLDHMPAIDEDGLEVDWRSLIQETIDLGYHSLMIDASRLPLDENIAASREVADMGHAAGCAVEAELGAVAGHEAGPLPDYEELFSSGKGFTKPEEAERFVKETGVDWLSIAFGSIHGAISGAARDQDKVPARLNIDHLKKIVACCGVPLVLHGGSGIQREYVLEAIRNGIAKINVGTAIRHTYERALGDTDDVERARAAVAEKITWYLREYFEIEGSGDKLL